MGKKNSGTCIAILADKNGKLIMATDRRMSWGMSQAQVMPGPKCFKREGILLAGTGDAHLCTLLTKRMHLPYYPPEINPEDYVHEAIYNSIKEILISKGFSQDDKNLHLPVDSSVELVVGIKGRVFSIDVCNPSKDLDFNGIIRIDEVSVPYATGCGGQLAWGSLLTTARIKKLGAEERLTVALFVASEVSPGCDNNIDFIEED